ncbi:MAG: hypothetical protein ABSH09_31010 [Bryobacteraceae bacterium]
MSLEEAILEKVRSLPAAKQEEVLRFADGLQKRGPVRMAGSRDRSREMVWIKENRGDYSYQWVVVEGERLIALTRTHTRSLPPPKPWASKFLFWYTFFRTIRSRLFRVGSMPLSLNFDVSHRYASAVGIEIPKGLSVFGR